MVQKSCVHQLRLINYPLICKVLCVPKVVQNVWTIKNSTWTTGAETIRPGFRIWCPKIRRQQKIPKICGVFFPLTAKYLFQQVFRKLLMEKKQITLLRVIPTMTCRVVVVRWGLSGWIGSVICATWITLRIIPTRDKEPWRNPSHLFSGILRALVVSCPPFSIAPGTSVCESKTQTCRRRNMPNHVRTPPGKHISINRHQTWQHTSWSKVKSYWQQHQMLKSQMLAVHH